MTRFILREAGKLGLGLLGAVLLAAAIAALSDPHVGGGLWHFLTAWGRTLDRFVHLDFGASAMTGTPALDILDQRLPLTLGLGVEGVVVALVVGIAVGLLFG